MGDSEQRTQQLLFLVWVHGFKGNQATFSDFPQDAAKAAQERYPDYDLHSVIYPKYRTVGELDAATHNFVLWLNRSVLDLEREKVDECGQAVHTTVILLGHSMGGMLVADAAKAVFDDRKMNPGRNMADVRGVIAIDTPYIGIHPGLVSYGMEQLDAYYDKALLDTAAFFENSPRFIKKGLGKMGIKTNQQKPASALSPEPKPAGKLTKGFTSILSLPGVASSSEWDWTREGRGMGVLGLRKAWSRASATSSMSELSGIAESEDAATNRAIDYGDTQQTSRPGSVRTNPAASLCRSESGGTSISAGRTFSRGQNPPLPPRRASAVSTATADTEAIPAGDQASLSRASSIAPPLPPRRGSHASRTAITSLDEGKRSNQDVSAERTGGEVDKIPGPGRSSPVTAGQLASPAGAETARAGPDGTPAVRISPPGPTEIGPDQPSQDGAAESMQTLSVSDGSTCLDPPEVQSGTGLAAAAGPGEAVSTSTDLTLAPDDSAPEGGTVAGKKSKKKDWKWVREHMEFMSSCWNVGGISRRMKGIEGMQREGLYFVNIYTVVRPSPPAHPRDRTFVSLPTIHHLTKDSWKPFIHDSAADQVEAHMALFDKKKHKGYGRLIEFIGNEIGEVLKGA